MQKERKKASAIVGALVSATVEGPIGAAVGFPFDCAGVGFLSKSTSSSKSSSANAPAGYVVRSDGKCYPTACGVLIARRENMRIKVCPVFGVLVV
ncbi:MAG: hypothetical protein ABIH21_05255 [Patescibacteria group bacterium]